MVRQVGNLPEHHTSWPSQNTRTHRTDCFNLHSDIAISPHRTLNTWTRVSESTYGLKLTLHYHKSGTCSLNTNILPTAATAYLKHPADVSGHPSDPLFIRQMIEEGSHVLPTRYLIFFLDYLTYKDGTSAMFRNVGSRLLFYAAWRSRRMKIRSYRIASLK
jgi:hypothetical protein